jgi:hypothetical protein
LKKGGHFAAWKQPQIFSEEVRAALITLSGWERDRNDYVEKAMVGAKADPLLAQNLASRFNRQTIAETLTYRPAEESRK